MKNIIILSLLCSLLLQTTLSSASGSAACSGSFWSGLCNIWKTVSHTKVKDLNWTKMGIVTAGVITVAVAAMYGIRHISKHFFRRPPVQDTGASTATKIATSSSRQRNSS